MAKTFTYGKQEKLKSRKLTEAVFKSGQTFTVFPLKVFYISSKLNTNTDVVCGVGAPARMFKKAVQRNRIKRLLREAYRLNKTELLQYVINSNKQTAIFILYIDKVMPEFATINKKMKQALDLLIQKTNESI